jgi:hypothetical protein
VHKAVLMVIMGSASVLRKGHHEEKGEMLESDVSFSLFFPMSERDGGEGNCMPYGAKTRFLIYSFFQNFPLSLLF